MVALTHSIKHMGAVNSNIFMAMKVMISCTEPMAPPMNSSGEEKETTPSTEVNKLVSNRLSMVTKETISFILVQIYMVFLTM